MAIYTGQLVPLDVEDGFFSRRPGFIVAIQNPHDPAHPGGVIMREGHVPVLAGTFDPHTPAPVVPAVFSGAVIPPQEEMADWPDPRNDDPARSATFYRDATINLPRLKDRFYGIAGKPRFTCSNLGAGLAYQLTVTLEEGPIGGPYAPYPSIVRFFHATGPVQTIELYLPLANQGREIRVTGASNQRNFGP